MKGGCCGGGLSWCAVVLVLVNLTDLWSHLAALPCLLSLRHPSTFPRVHNTMPVPTRRLNLRPTIVPKAGVAPPKRRLAGRWFRNSWRGQIVSPEPRTATTHGHHPRPPTGHEHCVEISCASAQHEQAHTMRVFCPCGWRMLVCCCRNVTSGNPSQHRLHQRSALHDHTASCAGSMIHMDYVKLL